MAPTVFTAGLWERRKGCINPAADAWYHRRIHARSCCKLNICKCLLRYVRTCWDDVSDWLVAEHMHTCGLARSSQAHHDDICMHLRHAPGRSAWHWCHACMTMHKSQHDTRQHKTTLPFHIQASVEFSSGPYFTQSTVNVLVVAAFIRHISGTYTHYSFE